MNDPAHRVVLVGRTNLDAALRLHEGVELLRAHTALEAVGELASMPGDIPGERTFVVVAPEVAIALEAPPALAERFVRAVHASAPGARVWVQTPLGISRDPGVFDGVLEHDNPLVFLRGGASGKRAEPVAAPVAVRPSTAASAAPVLPAAAATVGAAAAPASPAPSARVAAQVPVRPAPPPLPQPEGPPARVGSPAPAQPAAAAPRPAAPRAAAVAPVPAAPSAPAGPEAGDTQLVGLLIRRGDILPTALALVRERLNDTTVEFLAGPGDQVPGSAPPATLCPVTWDANTFGVLRSTRTRAAALAPQARWLAGWLRLRDQHTQLHEAAFTDALTGAWNRRYFDMFLGRALAEAREQRRFITVLVFDIDDFKQYNDRYGHGAGDDVLTQTVSLLRSVIRPTDRVCRIGGDEFAVIFDDPQGPRQEGSRHPRSVEEIAHRFQRQVAQHRFPALSGMQPGSLSISGGLATFPWDGSSPAELLKKADDLAMAAKREGKRSIFFGTPADRV
ncbi:MAG: GGDEF domain-containing protein [Phycisphaerales bacterium]